MLQSDMSSVVGSSKVCLTQGSLNAISCDNSSQAQTGLVLLTCSQSSGKVYLLDVIPEKILLDCHISHLIL